MNRDINRRDPLEEIREIIKNEVKSANGNFSQEQLDQIDGRVKGYLETISDRIVDQNTNEKSFVMPAWEKGDNGSFTMRFPIHKKSINAYQSVPGGTQLGTQPYRTLVQSDPLAGAWHEEKLEMSVDEQLDLGPSKFFVTRFSGLSFTKVDTTADDSSYNGTLTAEENVIESFESRMRGTKAAFGDIGGLRNAVMDEFVAQLGVTRLTQWFSALSGADFTKKVKSGVANKLPTDATVIKKMSNLMLALESQYRELECAFVVADRLFELIVNASSSDGEWVATPGDREMQRYSLFGFPLIPLSSQFPTVDTTGSLIAFFICPYAALKLGLRKDLMVIESEHEKLGSVSYWANSRFKYATKDVNGVAKMETGGD